MTQSANFLESEISVVKPGHKKYKNRVTKYVILVASLGLVMRSRSTVFVRQADHRIRDGLGIGPLFAIPSTLARVLLLVTAQADDMQRGNYLSVNGCI